MNYYNEFDPFAAAWLRELIKKGLLPNGIVDERSIVDVRPDELREFTQCHFFAGIGGWSYALQLAGWTEDRPVWTGSCPCQGFSIAGDEKGFEDQRHLWPVWGRLISQCKPSVVFGEQVERAIAHEWLDLVATDLEREEYAFGAAVLPACSVGIPHRRYRIFFVASNDSGERGKRAWEKEIQEQSRLQRGEDVRGVGAVFRRSDLPEPLVRSLSDGLPAGVGHDLLHGFGNAIVPQVAAEFIKAYLES